MTATATTEGVDLNLWTITPEATVAVKFENMVGITFNSKGRRKKKIFGSEEVLLNPQEVIGLEKITRDFLPTKTLIPTAMTAECVTITGITGEEDIGNEIHLMLGISKKTVRYST